MPSRLTLDETVRAVTTVMTVVASLDLIERQWALALIDDAARASDCELDEATAEAMAASWTARFYGAQRGSFS